jgi:voltage-gated potassium channel
MVGLSVIFLAVLILPLSASLTSWQVATLRAADLTIWGIFVAEYVLRIYLVRERLQWFRTHVFDLLVVAVPFLRPFRLLRVVAILLSSSKRAGALVVRQVLIYVAVLAAMVMAVCAVVVYHEENHARGSNIHSLGSAFWWAFTTVSTVGIGNEYPVTTTGRITAAILVLTGLALVGCITAAVAAAFVNAVRGKPGHEQATQTHANQQELSEKIDLLSEALTSLHHEVVAMRRHLHETSGNGAVPSQSQIQAVEEA